MSEVYVLVKYEEDATDIIGVFGSFASADAWRPRKRMSKDAVEEFLYSRDIYRYEVAP